MTGAAVLISVYGFCDLRPGIPAPSDGRWTSENSPDAYMLFLLAEIAVSS